MNNQLVESKNYATFGVIMAVAVICILVWLSYGRLSDYHRYHQTLAEDSVSTLAEDITQFIGERKRLVNLFAKENIELILSLALDPDDDNIRERLEQRIKLYFPDYFAFTIADHTGEPYYEDFDGLISESCASDLKSFATSETYEPYVHPNSEGYHFDVMAPYTSGANLGILFISFNVDILGSFIRASQSPGHNLMLIYPKLSDLIEVIAPGARNRITRNDYRLSDEEKSRILARVVVSETRWQAVDQYQINLFRQYQVQLLIEAIVLMALFVFVGLIMVLRIKREEQRRAEAENRRQALEQQKELIVGVISHELRTPISAITGSLEIIKEDHYTGLDKDKIQLIEIANNSAKRVLVLVNDLLDADTLESGNLTFELQECDIVKLVQSALNYNKIFADKFSVKLELKSCSESIMLKCDANRIDQVVTNLLTNAVKYGGENNKVDVSIVQTENTIRVEVKDYGPGISTQFQPYVFERYTVENSRSDSKFKSIGLGMHISKIIIEKHGGSIGFISSTDEGTTFYFELPTMLDSSIVQ